MSLCAYEKMISWTTNEIGINGWGTWSSRCVVENAEAASGHRASWRAGGGVGLECRAQKSFCQCMRGKATSTLQHTGFDESD